jgi:uncharacterized membrane protein (UPF0127 family)
MKNANPVSRFLVVAALGLLLGVSACGSDRPATKNEPLKTVSDYFPIKVGDRVVRMQLAIQPVEQQRGLMFRRDLGRDDGMLFIYERPQQMGFWMRNTPTPLDIGFFDPEGRLQEVYPMYPFDERTVSSRGSNLIYALEMNQNWFRENGVKPGAQMDLKALSAAMKARGHEPRGSGQRGL